MNNLPNPFPGPISFAQMTTTLQIAPGTQSPKQFKAKKAGTKGCLLFLVVDESGSMSDLTKDTIGGINTLIEDQAKDSIQTNLTIVKFEGGRINIPVDNVNVKEIHNFSDYRPLGMTNLLDAVGETITKINGILSSKKKEDRPSVIVQIITDGGENASRKFSRQQIKDMVKACEAADWIIGYVGANVDAFTESAGLGVSGFAASGYNAGSTESMYVAVSSAANRMKSMRGMGMNYADIQASVGSLYNEKEVATMNGDK